jgi:multicomponent Na+:H+ antiporter subunit D
LNAVVPLTVLVPMLTAGLLIGIRTFSNRFVADTIAILATLATLVLCAICLARASDHTVVYWWGAWTPRDGGVALGIDFAFGPLDAGMAVFASALMIAALVFSWRYLKIVDHLYHAVLLVFLTAMVGFCLSGDLFNMFVFFELMSVSAYVLAGFLIDKRSPLEGSLNFAITNSAGAILVLLGISLVYARTGALNLAQIGQTLAHGGAPDGLVVVAFTLIVCGFLVKAAAVPFHFWLADAYAVAPTPVCILFAGAMSELGLLGIARVYWTAFDGVLGPHAEALRWTLVTVGLITAFVGGLMAVAQHHLKRMLAFATVAYIGLFLVGGALLSADGLAGSAVYIVGDGFVKASLFVCVGMIQHRFADIDEVDLHGRCGGMKLVRVLFGVGALAVAGLPPFGPFLGKALVDDAVLKESGMAWVPAAMMVASALAAGALLRAGARIFFGLGEPGQPDESSDEAREDAEAEDTLPSDRTPRTMSIPAVLLLAAGLAWGLIPGLASSAVRSAARFVDQGAYAGVVLHGIERTPAHVPAFTGLSAGSYLYGAGATLGALLVAAAGVMRHRWLDRLRPGVTRLREIHSGHVGDYVAWLTTGVAVIGGTFALTLR